MIKSLLITVSGIYPSKDIPPNTHTTMNMYSLLKNKFIIKQQNHLKIYKLMKIHLVSHNF